MKWNENLLAAVNNSELYYHLMEMEGDKENRIAPLCYNAEQIACLSGFVVSRRYTFFLENSVIGDSFDIEWEVAEDRRGEVLAPWYHYIVGISSDVCERNGHLGHAYASAESGISGFTCVLCGWSFNCFM